MLVDAHGRPLPPSNPGVANTSTNFASAFIDMVAVEGRRQYRQMLHSSGLIAEWRDEWREHITGR